jgi:hypothetical protein
MVELPVLIYLIGFINREREEKYTHTHTQREEGIKKQGWLIKVTPSQKKKKKRPHLHPKVRLWVTNIAKQFLLSSQQTQHILLQTNSLIRRARQQVGPRIID